MSDAIRFLEALACDPRMAADDFGALRLLAPETRRAMLRRDRPALVRVLGGREWMACAVMLPDGEEPAEVPSEPEQVPDEPAEEERQSVSRVA